MKKANLIIPGMMLTLMLIVSCQREAIERTIAAPGGATALTTSSNQQSVTANRSSALEVCNPNAYIINLKSKTFVNDNWEWIWTVQNSNPGNGKNGTVQNLSHWGMQFGTCVDPAAIVGAAYSSNGFAWTNFTPSIQSDPSQGCMTTPMLKFDFGTTGSDTSYYRIVVNQDFEAGSVPGYYKSGVNTGCCTFYFTGIAGCGGPVEIEIVE
jgi:hypothetical protein